MYIKNKLIALEYRLILITCCLLGIISIFYGAKDFYVFNYYTVQSNILLLIFYTIESYFSHKDIKKHGILGCFEFKPRLKGAIVATISMAGLIYYIVLSKEDGNVGLDSILVHYVVPIMCVFDWVIFEKKKVFKSYDPFLWLAVPVAYLVFVFIKSEFKTSFPNGDRFPYLFLDIDKIGLSAVGFYVLVVAAIFVLIGEGFYVLDRFLPVILKKENKK